MNRRRSFPLPMSCVVVVLLAGVVLADGASRTAVDADPAQLKALGLKDAKGKVFTPDGSGVRIAVAETDELTAKGALREKGVPELNPPNGNMPAAGNGNGRVNILTPAPGGIPVTSHATMVVGVMAAPATGVAPNASYVVSGQSPLNVRLTNSQNMLRNGTGNNASILNWSLASAAGGATANGRSLGTLWADWADITQAGHPIQDKVIVIAGQERPPCRLPGTTSTASPSRPRRATTTPDWLPTTARSAPPTPATSRWT